MEINDIIAVLTDGLPAEQASIVRAAIERDSVRGKASGWKAQNEYAQIQQRQQELQADLEGGPDKPGARAYRDWYEKHYQAIQQVQTDLAKYQAKYGTNPDTPVTQTPMPQAMSPQQIQAEVDKRFMEQYAPIVSKVVINTGSLLQKHLLAGRKTAIDFDKLAQDANTKYGGDITRAYEEWDKPEQDRIAKEATEKEIERRVTEKLQQANTQRYFPNKEDSTPSSLSARPKDAVDKFDRSALDQDLLSTFIGAGEGNVQ